LEVKLGRETENGIEKWTVAGFGIGLRVNREGILGWFGFHVYH